MRNTVILSLPYVENEVPYRAQSIIDGNRSHSTSAKMPCGPITGNAAHKFCTACGIHSFYAPRSHSDKIDVNVRRIEEWLF